MENTTLNEIQQAEIRIWPYILQTPLLQSPYLSEISHANVYLKLENEQHTGSFKIRGATNKILTLTPEQKEKGVITASTGNHGQAVAKALQITKAKGIVFVPTNADSSKVAAMKAYGIEIQFYGNNSVETEIYAKKIAEEKGMIWISSYNDLQVIGGQGVIGIELIKQLDNIHAVFITIGGGGLISGIGTYMKSASPQTKIIGCLPENSDEMYQSIETGRYVKSENKETISDGSAGGFENGSITYDICKKVVDDFITVSEEEIKQVIKLMVDIHHKIIEGAAGVALASFIKNKEKFTGQNVVIVICGGNIATEKLKALL